MKVVNRNHRPIAIIGQGYVGLPLTELALKAGFHVVGIDNDRKKISRLSDGNFSVEGVSAEVIRMGLETGRYLPTSEYSDAEGFSVAVIAVPTPLIDNLPFLGHIEDAARSLGKILEPRSTVVLESTTYPGTTQELLKPILEYESGLIADEDFYLGYSPERIDPGSQNWGLLNTPKLVSADSQDSLDSLSNFYEELGIPTVKVFRTKVAEAAKLIENTFRHVNIALVNELAKFSAHLDVDIWAALEAASSKPFGYLPFHPGPGVGGHCLPVDPSYLSWAINRASGEDFKFVALANDINRSMPRYVADKVARLILAQHSPKAKGRVLLVGLSYKRGVGDLRESPGVEVGELLSQRGFQVFGIDDWVDEDSWPEGVIRWSADTSVSLDAALVLVNHPWNDLEGLVSKATHVFDCVNVLPPRLTDGKRVINIFSSLG